METEVETNVVVQTETKDKYKIAIIGSRTFTDTKKLFDILDKNFEKIGMIVSGGAKGADELGRVYAQERGFPCLIYYPRWRSVGGDFDRGAGFKRNYEIIKNCDIVLAFWDGVSNGTRHSLELAKQLNKKIKIVNFKVDPPKEEVVA